MTTSITALERKVTRLAQNIPNPRKDRVILEGAIQTFLYLFTGKTREQVGALVEEVSPRLALYPWGTVDFSRLTVEEMDQLREWTYYRADEQRKAEICKPRARL